MQELEIGQYVLDLLAIEKLLATDEHIGNVVVAQLLLKGSRLDVGAKQYREVAVAALISEAFGLNAFYHHAGFVLTIGAADAIDGRAGTVSGPQGFVLALLVVENQGVGSSQNVARGAIVLL